MFDSETAPVVGTGARVRVAHIPASRYLHLRGAEGTLIEIDALPGYEGGTFWKVRLANGAVIDWHRDCFEAIA